MSARRTRSSADSLPATPEGKPKRSARALASIIERSSRIQGPAAAAYVDRLRRADPDAGPATIVAKLEKRFVTAVTASGAAVGSTAVLPGLGTLAALSAAAGETAVFLEATAFYALAVAAVYGVSPKTGSGDAPWCSSVLVGDDSKQAMSELIGGGPHQRGVAVGGHGIAADAGLGTVELAVAQAGCPAVHATAQRPAVRQDPAGRDRRRHRRRRQPDGGQEDRA